jgi:8-oxo-dGTP diphosphatase
VRVGLAYAAVADLRAPLAGEDSQLPAWFRLDDEWPSIFPEDRGRIRAYLAFRAERA